jgi:hypothetical protein
VDPEFASAHTPPTGFPAVTPESPAADAAVPAEAEAETGSVPGTMFDDTVFDDEQDAEAATGSDAPTADAPAAGAPSSQVGMSMSDGAPESEPSDPGTSEASTDPVETGADPAVETPAAPQSSGNRTFGAASPTEASTPDPSEVATPDLVASDAPAASTADSPPAEALVEDIATDEDGGAASPSGAGVSSEAEQPSGTSPEAEGPEGPRTTG